MHQVTEYAGMEHFADDRRLLYGHKSIKKINQIIKIVDWLRQIKFL